MRASILSILRQNAGEYLSGEELSRQLDVSRTAVWKHIRLLKQEGYEIEAHSRLGYCLRQTPDLLLPDEIRAHRNVRLLGKEIHHFMEIDSTNNEAKKYAAAGCPEGTLVVAEAQNGGRGRLARGWFSPVQKGIWLSAVLKPLLRPIDAPKFTLLAAVAITRAIRNVAQVECGIKWPNDILFQGKKLVGILTEMSAEIDVINYIVIGMGINVNIDSDEFPAEIAGIATSVAAAAGWPIARIELLTAILTELESLYYTAINEGFFKILDEWRALSITLGHTVNVVGVNQQFAGVALDIDAEGALLVDTAHGIERVVAGDVSVRKA